MIVSRLRWLIKSSSYKYALNFSQKAIQAIDSKKKEDMFQHMLSLEQFQELQEVYILILFKFKKYDTLEGVIQSLNEAEIFQLMQIGTEATKNELYRLSKYKTQLRQLALHFYVIRLLNVIVAELNYVQEKRYDEEFDAAQIMELERKIAPRFLLIGQALGEYEAVARECILTAFSLDSSTENYKKVLLMARQLYSYLEINDRGYTSKWYSNSYIDSIRAGSLGYNIPSTSNYDETQAPSLILTSLKIFTETMRQDICNVLFGARLEQLSWTETWPNLNRHCRELLDAKKKIEIIDKQTASANEKLKFLNIFDHEYFEARYRQENNQKEAAKKKPTRKKRRKASAGSSHHN